MPGDLLDPNSEPSVRVIDVETCRQACSLVFREVPFSQTFADILPFLDDSSQVGEECLAVGNGILTCVEKYVFVDGQYVDIAMFRNNINGLPLLFFFFLSPLFSFLLSSLFLSPFLSFPFSSVFPWDFALSDILC